MNWPVGGLTRQKGGIMQTQLNTRIAIATMELLNEYAATTGKSKASIVDEALQEFIRQALKQTGKS